ncbi:MAG: hypothetical protein KC468_19840 [Myxococcales bacterium]|nr:hypothetical protein [Myxococcales bacterium]
MDPVSSKPRLNVAFIGHHHHGKTTLLAAVLARLAAEPGCEARALAVAELDQVENPEWRTWRPMFRELGPVTVRPRRLVSHTTRRTLGLMDCPGLRRRIKQTAWAVATADVAVLVVAADAGPGAQTQEHVRIAAAAGVRSFVVFVNKCDQLTDEARADEVELELRELVERCAPGIDGDELRVIRGAAARALSGDALWSDGVRRLIEALEDDIPVPRRDTDASATQLVIDRVYPALHGQKPRVLVTATILRGRVAVGDRLVRVGLGDPRIVQLQSLEVDGRRVEEALAGVHIGMVLRPGDSLAGDALRLYEFDRGQRLVHPGLEDARDMFCARVQLIDVEHGGRHTPLVSGHRAQLLLGAAAVTAELTLIHGGALEPAGAAEVFFQLDEPLHLARGMHFMFRDGTDGLQWLEGGPCVWGGTVGRGEIYALGVPPGLHTSAEDRILDRLKS